jgi:uncharacterized protein (TIRG00374 family)
VHENPQLEDVGNPESEEPVGSSFKSQASKWLSIILPILLGFYLIVYTYNSFTPAQISNIKGYFKNANYLYIFIAAIIAVLGNASRAYRWKYVLGHMGYASTFHNNFMAVNIGYLLNLTVPKSGEISRAVIVRKCDGIPFDKGFGSIVAERIVDMVILLMFMMLAFFMQFDIVKAFVLDKIPVNNLVIIVMVAVFGFTSVLLVYMYSKSPLILKLKQRVSGLKEGVFSLLYMKDKWKYIAHTIFIWGSYVLTFYVTIFTLDQTSNLSFDAVVTSFVVGSIAIAFTNSGFGAYPFLITQILLFYAIPKEVGTAFGWIVWTSQMFVVVIMGTLSFLLLPVFNRSK